MAQKMSVTERATLGMLAKGVYACNVTDTTSQTWNANAEQKQVLKAGGSSGLVCGWLRAKAYIYGASELLKLTVAVVKARNGDSIPDLSSSAVLEDLRADGKLFFIKRWLQGAAALTGQSTRIAPVEVEFYNIKLDKDEELWLVWFSLQGITDGVNWNVVEDRTVYA